MNNLPLPPERSDTSFAAHALKAPVHQSNMTRVEEQKEKMKHLGKLGTGNSRGWLT